VSERILLVEDDSLTAEGVAFVLREEGFEVDVTEDGGTALERARARPPDLVVLDIRLPGGVSGMDVCRELRSESAVPILMLTGRGSEVETVLALERGADDYVTKPFSLAELVARCGRSFGAARARAQAAGRSARSGRCGSTSSGTKSQSTAS
jgi:DNA-binding response OmpR family regulator